MAVKELCAPLDDLEWLYVPDVVYAERETGELKLQLIVPMRRQWSENETYPVLLFVPGAAWYHQEMYNGIPQLGRLAQMGMLIAYVQVRASTQAHFPAQVEDIYEAMRYMAANASVWHADPQRMYLAGNSSGGHLALLTALSQVKTIETEKDFALRGIIAQSAPTDMPDNSGKPRCDLVGVKNMADAPEKAAAASCGTYVDKDAPIPPVLLMHGQQDEIVPIEESRMLYRQLCQADKQVELVELPGVNHGGAPMWSDKVLRCIADFVERNGALHS